MKVIWTNDETKTGIHLYSQNLLRKIMIPYVKGKLPVTSTIYMHNDNPEKNYVIIDTPKRKERLTVILKKVFSKEYRPPKKIVYIKPVGPIRPKKMPTYEPTEDDWKYRDEEKPKKKGGISEWM